MGRAADEPSTLFIGVDANHAGLIDTSRRAAARGNVRFVLGSLDSLPGVFAGRADSVSILFPWGSLLQAVASAEPEQLAKIAGTCRSSATIEVVTAIEPAADTTELARLGLGGFSVEAMLAGWRAQGFLAELEELPAGHAYQTTWWRKIRSRPGRTAYRLTAFVPASADSARGSGATWG